MMVSYVGEELTMYRLNSVTTIYPNLVSVCIRSDSTVVSMPFCFVDVDDIRRQTSYFVLSHLWCVFVVRVYTHLYNHERPLML